MNISDPNLSIPNKTSQVPNQLPPVSFDIMGIQSCQRNRFPLLFIDKVSVVPGESAKGIKNFTFNEWFFPAHFDDEPSVPGFVLIESLVQTFIMTFLSLDKYKGMKTNFISMDQVSFKKKIIPGDQLEIHAKLDQIKRGIAKGSAEGFVLGTLAIKAEFIVCLPQVLESFKPGAQTL